MIKYIINILKNEDTVFVNNLGLFEKKMIETQMIDGVLYPPQYKLFFNDKGDGNGFAFVLKYAENEKKRLNEANAEIEAWVEELKSGLQNNKSIHFERFGTFSLDKKGEIILEPTFIKEFNLDFEGMEPIEANPIKPEKEPKQETASLEKIEEPEQKGPEIVKTIEEPEIHNPIEDNKIELEQKEPEIHNLIENNKIEPEPEPESKLVSEEIEIESDDEIGTKKKRRSWIWILLVLLLLGIGGGAYCLYIHCGDVVCTFSKKENTQVIPSKPIPSSTPELADTQSLFSDSVNYTDTITEEEITVEIIETTPMPEHKTTAEKKSMPPTKAAKDYPVIDFKSGNYYLIAGSLSSKEDAIRHIGNKKLDKYKPQIIKQQGNNKYRVCIGTFDSEEKAIELALTLNFETWILK